MLPQTRRSFSDDVSMYWDEPTKSAEALEWYNAHSRRSVCNSSRPIHVCRFVARHELTTSIEPRLVERTKQLGKFSIFYTPPAFKAPLGATLTEFRNGYEQFQETSVSVRWGCHVVKEFDSMFSRLYTIPNSNRQTDGWTSCYRYSLRLYQGKTSTRPKSLLDLEISCASPKISNYRHPEIDCERAVVYLYLSVALCLYCSRHK